MRVISMQFAVMVVLDQHLVQFMTCLLPLTQDQTPTPTQTLVSPTTSHMVTLTEKPPHAPCLAGATSSPHPRWKHFTSINTPLTLLLKVTNFIKNLRHTANVLINAYALFQALMSNSRIGQIRISQKAKQPNLK